MWNENKAKKIIGDLMDNKRENESIFDYKVRLFQNHSRYGFNWSKVRDILGDMVNPDTVRKSARGYLEAYRDLTENKFDKNILFLNDIHLPFERKDIIEIVKKHAHEITHLVIGGDLLDCYDISIFPHDNTLSIVDELKYGYRWLSEVRNILGANIPIYLIKGNHEARFEKLVLKDKTLQNFINPNILQMYQDGFSLYIGGKKEKFKPIKNLHYINSWYINLDNKILFSHPIDFSMVDGKLCENIAAHFINKGEIADVYIFGHTHKYCQQTVSRRQNVYVVENGCLCQPMKYSNTGKLGYTKQHYCYTLIGYNDNLPVNMNDIRVIHLDDENLDNICEKVKL